MIYTIYRELNNINIRQGFRTIGSYSLIEYDGYEIYEIIGLRFSKSDKLLLGIADIIARNPLLIFTIDTK